MARVRCKNPVTLKCHVRALTFLGWRGAARCEARSSGVVTHELTLFFLRLVELTLFLPAREGVSARAQRGPRAERSQRWAGPSFASGR